MNEIHNEVERFQPRKDNLIRRDSQLNKLRGYDELMRFSLDNALEALKNKIS